MSYLASTDGQLQSMEVLLKVGAHADARSDIGQTALMLAMQQGNAEASAKLLKLVCQLPKGLSACPWPYSKHHKDMPVVLCDVSSLGFITNCRVLASSNATHS